MKMFGLLVIAVIITLPLLPFVFVAQVLFFVFREDKTATLSDYFKTCALGFDQLGGSVLYNEEDFTVSSMTYVKAIDGSVYANHFMRFIDFLALKVGDDKDHCARSYVNELEKLRGLLNA